MYLILTTKFGNILSIVLLAIGLISYIALLIVQKKHREDPEYAKRQAEREREAKRKAEENAALEQSLMSGYNETDSENE